MVGAVGKKGSKGRAWKGGGGEGPDQDPSRGQEGSMDSQSPCPTSWDRSTVVRGTGWPRISTSSGIREHQA